MEAEQIISRAPDSVTHAWKPNRSSAGLQTLSLMHGSRTGHQPGSRLCHSCMEAEQVISRAPDSVTHAWKPNRSSAGLQTLSLMQSLPAIVASGIPSITLMDSLGVFQIFSLQSAGGRMCKEVLRSWWSLDMKIVCWSTDHRLDLLLI